MNNKKGFTLVEILAVIVILSILIVIFYPIVNKTSQLTRESISETKKKTIVSAAEKYGNANINKFQECIGTYDTMSNELKNRCIYDVESVVNNLLEKGFLNDDKKELLNNPATNEQFNGSILFCYDIKDISIKTLYLESETDAYDCSGSSINYLRLSSNSGIVYAGTKKEIDIISITKPKNISVTNVPGINITVSSDYKKLTISAPQNASEIEKVPVKVTAMFEDGEPLYQTYTLTVKNVDFGLDANDVTNDSICLEVNEEKNINIVGNNLGKINPSFKNYNMEVAINGANLHLKGKQPGESDLILTESNSNKMITLKNNVYSLDFIDAIPKSMYLNESRVIKIETKGLDSITVSNSTGNLTFSEVSTSSFKVKATKASSNRVPITIKGYVKHRGTKTDCFEKTYYIDTIDAARFELPEGLEEHLVLYTDNPPYTFEVGTDQTGLYCESPNNSLLSCTVDNKTIALKPYSTPVSNIDVKIGLKSGNSKYLEKTIHTEIKKMDIELDYSNDRYPSTVCRDVRKNTNDDTVSANFDTLKIVETSNTNDWCFEETVTSNRLITPSPRKNVLDAASSLDKTCDRTFKNNDNTGISKVSVIETNTKVTADFDYRIYRMDLYKDSTLIEDSVHEVSLNPGDEETYELVYSYIGDEKYTDYVPNIIVSTPDIITYEVTDVQDKSGSKTDVANYERKLKLKIKMINPGTTTIFIKGSACGTKTIKVLVTGNIECPEIYTFDGIYDGEDKTIIMESFPANGYALFSIDGSEYDMMPPLRKEVGIYKVKTKVQGYDYFIGKNCKDSEIKISNAMITFINNTDGTLLNGTKGYTKLGSNTIYDDEYSYTEVTSSNRPIIEKVGYNFDGWYKNSTYENQIMDSTNNILSNTTYTDSNAKWNIIDDIDLFGKISKKKFTLTYNANGGTNAPDSQELIYGEASTITSSTPSRNDYEFLGWALSDSATSAVYGPGDTISATDNITLYAVWKVSNYTVSVNVDYGYASPSSRSVSPGTNTVFNIYSSNSDYVTDGATVTGEGCSISGSQVSVTNVQSDVRCEVSLKRVEQKTVSLRCTLLNCPSSVTGPAGSTVSFQVSFRVTNSQFSHVVGYQNCAYNGGSDLHAVSCGKPRLTKDPKNSVWYNGTATCTLKIKSSYHWCELALDDQG